MRALLRPPAHRGPLIAAGAVVLATGIVMAQGRLEDPVGDGIHLAYAALAAALLLALGFQARLEDRAPAAHQSVLLVTGLVLLAIALVRLADVLGAGDADYPSGAAVWTSLVLGLVALAAGVRRHSAYCVFIAGLAGVSAILNAVDWLFSPESTTPYRWLMVVLATAFVLGSLVLRGQHYRESVLLVDLAGLLVVAIGATLVEPIGLFAPFATDAPGAGWELLILTCACGLVAFGAVDRQPGPAYLGVASLLLFVVLAVPTPDGDDSLLWWPLLLLALGAGTMAVGLRPRDPLPPEPAPYGVTDLPRASRTDDDATVVRVRIDDPPA